MSPFYFYHKTDVTPAIFSRNFVARVFSRDKIASVTWRVARVFKSRATLFPNRALLYFVQLCWQNAERWLISFHRCFRFASVRCIYSSFAQFILIYLIYSTWKWNDGTRIHCISLNYTRRGLIYATKSQRATGQSQSRDFVAHSRDKIARENCRCDIGLTSVSYTHLTLPTILRV